MHENLLFRHYVPEDYNELVPMIMELYAKDGATTLNDMSIEKINRTIAELTDNIQSGEIFIFEQEKAVVGYAIVTSFWSNEFGGRALLIDELLVKAANRNKGISTRFFNFLFDKKLYDEVVYLLEVGNDNKEAAHF
jgi:hypothetical protein